MKLFQYRNFNYILFYYLRLVMRPLPTAGILLFFNPSLHAQIKTIGTPFIRNIDRTYYKAGLQTWMITTSANGMMYFANNDGILEYDGVQWRLYPLPEGPVVRSVLSTADGRIYAGGFNQIGYFEPDSIGKLLFRSLHPIVPEPYRDYGEVWKIHSLPVGVVFQSFDQLMIYRNDSIRVIRAPEVFHFSFLVNGELYINDEVQGLFRLAGDRLLRVPGTERIRGQLIWTMLPVGDQILIGTTDNGVYRFDGMSLEAWENPAGEFLKNNQVYCGLKLSRTTLAFGTIQDGLIICDTAGNIHQSLNIDKGLQNNTVLSLGLDQYNNLWLGLDNGIDYIEINSPLTIFASHHSLSAGYAGIMHKGILYFGTNRGLFYRDWSSLNEGNRNGKFNLIPGTQGQVWSLEVVDGTLFCGHNSGIFIIEGTTARLLSDVMGGWTFIRPQDRNELLICGTYTSLVRFEKKNGSWQPGTRIEGFKESSRFLVSSGPRTLWMSHGYKGVFRIHLNAEYDSVTKVDFFNHLNGLPGDRNINVMDLNGNPVFTTDEGFYLYDPRTNRFIPDEQMNLRFPVDDIRTFKEDSDGNLWYFTTKGAGVFRLQEDGNYVNVDVPFRELDGEFINWFQFVYPLNKEHVFFGVKDGFIHYTPEYPKNYQKGYDAFIRTVRISENDSMIYWGSNGGSKHIGGIPYRLNQIRVDYAANDFENPAKIVYSSRLEGFDKDWTAWQSRSQREFTNLHHGIYTFRVKARNIFGIESREAVLEFEIFPPWYLSWWAYGLYFLLLLAWIFLLFRYIRYRMEKSKQKEKEYQQKMFREREKQLQTETLEAEKEVIRLRNEKLREEMIQKDKELANKTMQMILKNKSLIAIKKDLNKLSRELGDDIITGHINTLVRKINREIESNNQWEVFERHFESVHEQFLRRLKAHYPDLTPREMKLCAYLRLNISSKEIASLMNISARGVEISRYRLRKKLNLGRDSNLTDFIISY